MVIKVRGSGVCFSAVVVLKKKKFCSFYLHNHQLQNWCLCTLPHSLLLSSSPTTDNYSSPESPLEGAAVLTSSSSCITLTLSAL